MPADELLGERLDDVAEIEGAFLFGHACVKDDLEQEVAELVLEVVAVAARDRVGDLIGFLDGVGRDGREGLLQVPGAAHARRAQPRHDLDQPADVARGLHAALLAEANPPVAEARSFVREFWGWGSRWTVLTVASHKAMIRRRHIMEHLR